MTACSSSNPNLFIRRQPKSLQSLCHQKIDSHFTLEKQLYHLGLYGDLGYVFTFERIVKSVSEIANSRHKLNKKSFEKWFRKYVNEAMDLLTENRDDSKTMLDIAKRLVQKIYRFRAVFGIAAEVLHQVEYLVYFLGKY